MQDVARIPSLIIVGIWGATLSSALGGLLGAPRTLQAIADDGIVPKIFGKTFGPMGEPRIATLATFLVALLGTYFGSVNLIAPLLTMICLICYAVLNLSAGIETLMANPSWRPRFRVHWSISISGAILCLVTMLMIDAGWALLSLFLVVLIYFLVKKRQFKTAWVDIRQGILMFFSRLTIYQLAYGASSFKSWRPHFLVFTKSSEEHSTSLLQFSEAISQSRGFLTMASFISKGKETIERRKELTKKMVQHFKDRNIQAFVQIKEVDSITSGMNLMIEHYGLGPLVPNTIVFGGIRKEDESIDFVGVLQSALERHYNIVILNEDNRIQSAKKGSTTDIHLWWDDAHRNNSELMLVFAYMLQRNPAWKRARICVKAVVENEIKKEKKLIKFQNISVTKRLPLDIEVFVASNPNERLELVKEFSTNAAIVLMSLNSPPPTGECVEDYVAYLHTLSELSAKIPSLSLVLSSEHTPLETILE
jgi:Amino acid permease/Solute carrier family 12